MRNARVFVYTVRLLLSQCSSAVAINLKRKLTTLSVKTKNELLDDLERGVPVVECVAKYGVAKQTISDIKKKKEQIRAYAKLVASGSSVSDPALSKKRFRLGTFTQVEDATLKWYRQ